MYQANIDGMQPDTGKATDLLQQLAQASQDFLDTIQNSNNTQVSKRTELPKFTAGNMLI